MSASSQFPATSSDPVSNPGAPGTPSPTALLSQAGVSIWLDDLSRKRLETGDLENLITERSVVGVTTNPSIFQNAISGSSYYDEDLAAIKGESLDTERVVFELMAGDVRRACKLFEPIFATTYGQDGRVSIEVSPLLAYDTGKTVDQVKYLRDRVDHPGVYVKIPATEQGIEAIAQSIAQGISVNVTLIFSLSRYAQVLDAYLRGLGQAHAAGLDISTIYSVASFFVSRVDTEVDKRLSELVDQSSQVVELKGKTGIANARLAYQLFEQTFETPRAQALLAQGARLQRPLWASTGVKDPSIRDTAYVEDLVAPHTVNTMPEKTLEATFDHGRISSDTITGNYKEAQEVIDSLSALGIDLTDVTDQLEREGIEKFVVAWESVFETVEQKLEQLRSNNG